MMDRPSIYEDALINNIVITEYGEYLTILEWIEQNIRIHKECVVEITYMKKILGPEFKKKYDDAIFASLKYALAKHDIYTRMRSKSGVTKLIMCPPYKYKVRDVYLHRRRAKKKREQRIGSETVDLVG